MSNTINIPEKHFIGITPGNSSRSYITHDGDDKLADQRKKKIEARVGKDNCTTVNNTPLIGFTINKNHRVGSYFSNSFSAWIVNDPRGFEMEISSTNLEYIMKYCTIENLEIQEKCVWGRNKSSHVLIPVTSPIYKDAVINSERMKKSVNLDDLEFGDYFITNNGKIGLYLGTVYHCNKFTDYSDNLDFSFRKIKIYIPVETNKILNDSYPEFESKIKSGSDAGQLIPISAITSSTKISDKIKPLKPFTKDDIQKIFDTHNHEFKQTVDGKDYISLNNGWKNYTRWYSFEKPTTKIEVVDLTDNDIVNLNPKLNIGINILYKDVAGNSFPRFARIAQKSLIDGKSVLKPNIDANELYKIGDFHPITKEKDFDLNNIKSKLQDTKYDSELIKWGKTTIASNSRYRQYMGYSPSRIRKSNNMDIYRKYILKFVIDTNELYII